MDDLYQEIILDRFKDPHNKGEIEGGIQSEEINFSCGDRIKIGLKINREGKIEDAKFSGGGCAISMAAADMLLDRIKGMRLEEVKKIPGKEIEEMMGVELTPMRKKCAYLVLETLKKVKNPPLTPPLTRRGR